MNKYNNNNGFTLIELSIVLVIIGLLVGLGSNMIGPLTTFVKVRETRDIQDAVLQSVTSWASSGNSIPNAENFPTVAKSPLDAWGRDLIYLYDENLYSVSPTKDTICGRRSTTLKLDTTDPAATMTNVAFVVLSGAENANLKSTLDGTFNGTSFTNIISVSGAATGTITVTGPNSDLVRWVTLDELRSKIGCQGAQLKIVNNELPVGAVDSSYNATISADGGVLFEPPDSYRWCIETSTAPASLFFKKPDGTVVDTTNLFQANCPGHLEASWPLSESLVISGNPIGSNSYFFTVFVKDNDSNVASKPFVLTVNPQ